MAGRNLKGSQLELVWLVELHGIIRKFFPNIFILRTRGQWEMKSNCLEMENYAT